MKTELTWFSRATTRITSPGDLSPKISAPRMREGTRRLSGALPVADSPSLRALRPLDRACVGATPRAPFIRDCVRCLRAIRWPRDEDDDGPSRAERSAPARAARLQSGPRRWLALSSGARVALRGRRWCARGLHARRGRTCDAPRGGRLIGIHTAVQHVHEGERASESRTCPSPSVSRSPPGERDIPPPRPPGDAVPGPSRREEVRRDTRVRVSSGNYVVGGVKLTRASRHSLGKWDLAPRQLGSCPRRCDPGSKCSSPRWIYAARYSICSRDFGSEFLRSVRRTGLAPLRPSGFNAGAHESLNRHIFWITRDSSNL